MRLFKELKCKEKGDFVYRIYPDFKEFRVSSIEEVKWNDEIREYKLLAVDGEPLGDRSLYPLVKSTEKPLIRTTFTNGSSRLEIYTTDPNFRHFYETDRESKLRRLLVGDRRGKKCS